MLAGHLPWDLTSRLFTPLRINIRPKDVLAGRFRVRSRRSALILQGAFLQSGIMKLVRWRRFIWDVSKLPTHKAALPNHYNLRAAERDELRTIRNVIFSAFSLDTSWSDTFITFREMLDTQLELAFSKEAVPALVITHGQRIIAASALNSEIDAETHLTSGPCVLVEYRNRGLGSTLLHASLLQLQKAGLTRCTGICKDTAPTSKFVYPKFGSTNEPYNFIPSPVEQ